MSIQTKSHRRKTNNTSTVPILYSFSVVFLLSCFRWPWRWLASGAPLLSLVLFLGDTYEYRVLEFVHIWTLFTTINLIYSIVSTSWLLYWCFLIACYPAILLICMFQFRPAASLTRRVMRGLIRRVHFIDDKVALFDIPALEVDTNVAGLANFRGLTVSLSTLTAVLHGAEVGIKLNDDMEIAIQTEKVVISLFRRVEVGDCFVNFKGGGYEMTFKNDNISSEKKVDSVKDVLFDNNSPILRAATFGSSRNSSISEDLKESKSNQQLKDEVTDGNSPADTTPSTALKSIQTYSFNEDPAGQEYDEVIKHLDETNAIAQSRRHIKYMESVMEERNKGATDVSTPIKDQNALRAAICSSLHSKPSVPNPPKYSIKVTTLRNLSNPRVKRFLHRLPFLLRLLLNVITYLHPVTVSSITGTISGGWLESLLVKNIFKGYGDSDQDLQRFKSRISDWISGANFAVQLTDMVGYANVPVNAAYDIENQLAFKQISAYRALPMQVDLTQVLKLGGADAHVSVPSSLLPHHEHLLPPKKEPSSGGEKEDEGSDEAQVKISAHVRLPAVLDQELLDFVAVLVKASKLVELESQANGHSSDSDEKGKSSHGIGMLNKKLKIGMKKALVANDQWLARQVGKIMKKLEQISGDLGYTGDIPVKLKPYRETGWFELEGEKLLP